MVLNYGVITADDDERLDVTLRLAKLEMSRDELIKWMRENSISDQRFIVRDRIQKHLRAPRFNTSK